MGDQQHEDALRNAIDKLSAFREAQAKVSERVLALLTELIALRHSPRDQDGNFPELQLDALRERLKRMADIIFGHASEAHKTVRRLDTVYMEWMHIDDVD